MSVSGSELPRISVASATEQKVDLQHDAVVASPSISVNAMKQYFNRLRESLPPLPNVQVGSRAQASDHTPGSRFVKMIAWSAACAAGRVRGSDLHGGRATARKRHPYLGLAVDRHSNHAPPAQQNEVYSVQVFGCVRARQPHAGLCPRFGVMPRPCTVCHGFRCFPDRTAAGALWSREINTVEDPGGPHSCQKLRRSGTRRSQSVARV